MGKANMPTPATKESNSKEAGLLAAAEEVEVVAIEVQKIEALVKVAVEGMQKAHLTAAGAHMKDTILVSVYVAKNDVLQMKLKAKDLILKLAAKDNRIVARAEEIAEKIKGAVKNVIKTSQKQEETAIQKIKEATKKGLEELQESGCFPTVYAHPQKIDSIG